MQRNRILGIVIGLLLLGSFPVRSYFETIYSDLMRLAGFILLLIYNVCKDKQQKK